jgi:hypothetical protein
MASASQVESASLEAVARVLADQLALLYDARPGDPQARLDGNVLAFTFAGGLSPSDERLLEVGRGEQAREFRERFLEAVEPQLRAIVAGLLTVEVQRFFAGFEPESRRTECYFVLVPATGGVDEQRRALINWGKQVRRNARELRARHQLALAAHTQLRDALQVASESAAGGP